MKSTIFLLTVFIVAVTAVLSVLQFAHLNSRAVLGKKIFFQGSSTEVLTSAQNVSASAPIKVLPTTAKVISSSEPDAMELAWSASTGLEVLVLLKNADFSDAQVRRLLDTIRSACLMSQKPYSDEAESAWGVISANHANAMTIFGAQYCGDVSLLVARIDFALAPHIADLKRRIEDSIARGVEFEGKPPPQQWINLEKLTVASATSIEATDALINEGLVQKDPFMARNIAERLVPASEANGTLADWNAYFPPSLPKAERSHVFTIAAELNACSQIQACRANRPFVLYQCAHFGHRTCAPNEDLLSYRRRTTSPMLFQAAEQIAAAMQARRYR